jgi:hypothetical protein
MPTPAALLGITYTHSTASLTDHPYSCHLQWLYLAANRCHPF